MDPRLGPGTNSHNGTSLPSERTTSRNEQSGDNEDQHSSITSQEDTAILVAATRTPELTAFETGQQSQTIRNVLKGHKTTILE